MIFKHLSVPGERGDCTSMLRTMAERKSASQGWDGFQQAWEDGDGDRRGQGPQPGGYD